MYKTIIVLVVLLIFEGGDKKNVFTSPLDIPLVLSANFGELRPGHFHSGVDFKTNGVSGKKILSVEDGYIYRISVSPGGFGNALYIRHNQGISSVYGHLNRFIPEIESYVSNKQYDRKSFSVNLFPDKQMFQVKKGDLIGYSGNSGSSHGPHLHFELRKSSSENPINPLEYFYVADDIKPVLKQMVIYPINSLSEVDGKRSKTRFNLDGSKGTYRISSNKIIETAGRFGIGISTHDFLNNSWNKCGIKSIKVTVDSTVTYKHSLNEFSFSQTRYINSHIDFAEYKTNKTYVQKTFVDPNNFLAIYDTLVNEGIMAFTDNQVHNINIEVRDYSDNISKLQFSMKGVQRSVESPIESNYIKIMPFNQKNDFVREDLKVEFSSDSFYDTLYFTYSKASSNTGYLSDIHSIHDITFPVHKAYSLSIKPDISDSSLLSKAGIVMIQDNKPSFVGGDYKDGYITTRLSELGDFAIGIDTIPPVISPLNFRNGGNIAGRDELLIKIEDEFSGIKEYKGIIDGEWALFEWDPKNNLIKHIFKKGTIDKNMNHTVVITTSDARNNTSEYAGEFYW